MKTRVKLAAAALAALTALSGVGVLVHGGVTVPREDVSVTSPSLVELAGEYAAAFESLKTEKETR
ncbi:hypothetical protein [Mycolicibacterium lutetiense]|uniref:Uncharacterized protein n=1 Tax=Mycolicibacterium lutetiense TaxID=1641992 RepID=A0ABS4ZSL8_9MYCO|nr:hypothetical protein [Mycolicibacterium lutetiense]MBP2452492.1 hypothetical protein [Mycolicibacterium lutetiense]